MRRLPLLALLVTAATLFSASICPQAFARSATATGPIASGHSWSSDFATGNFDQWSWWGQGQSQIWGKIAVVSPSSVNIPALFPGDTHIAQMTVTPSDASDGRVNAKLYKGFGVFHDGVERPPKNVSGLYSAWYYIPSSYRVPLNTGANIFQFKEKFALPDGSSQSNPLWWVQLSTASWAQTMDGRWIGARPHMAQQPVAVLNHWGNQWKQQPTFEAVPLNRWFRISAVIRQGHSMRFSIDGKPYETVSASEYPVSPFYRTGQEWTFGVGNYSNAPGTTLYIGRASFQGSSTAAPRRGQAQR